MSPPFIQPMPQAETKGTDINVEQLGGRVSNVTEKLNRFQFGCVCWLCFCLPSKIASRYLYSHVFLSMVSLQVVEILV